MSFSSRFCSQCSVGPREKPTDNDLIMSDVSLTKVILGLGKWVECRDQYIKRKKDKRKLLKNIKKETQWNIRIEPGKIQIPKVSLKGLLLLKGGPIPQIHLKKKEED